MQQIFVSKQLVIRSKFRWFPSLNTKFELLDGDGTKLGEIIFQPAWSYPFLWFLGLFLEVGFIFLGGYVFALYKTTTAGYIGLGIGIFGVISLFFLHLRSFLASRAASVLDVRGNQKDTVFKVIKKRSFFRPIYTVIDPFGKVLGQSKKGLFSGDRRYTLFDGLGKPWGFLRRGFLGVQYNAYRKENRRHAVATLSRKNIFLDARQIVTGYRSFLIDFSNQPLNHEERALLLGTLASVDPLLNQKKIRQEKAQPPPPSVKA